MHDFHTILTHPGSAHKDELLACAVLLAVRPAPIVRREPTVADLADPLVCVVDVGLEHEPSRSNFDHHQLPVDHAPTCSLSLVLQCVALYDDARLFCDWLETVEWFDCRGAITTATWLGVERTVLSKLSSPIELSLLRRFAQAERLEAGDPLWELLRMVGEDLLDYVRGLRARIAEIERVAELWELDTNGGLMKVLFIPRSDPLLEDSSSGLGHYIAARGWENEVVGIITPDRRGSGYGLSRYNDNPKLDFTRIVGESDVRFAHKNGFVAKTDATGIERLRALLALAVV